MLEGSLKVTDTITLFLSKFSQEDLDKIDKLAQDAEEIVRKRVYKD